jgi:DNA-binding XRE family transcriptional regulator
MRLIPKSNIFETGQRLFALRTKLGYTREEMARKLGLIKKTYYKHEVGLALPCLETLKSLQDQFDISMDWFLFKKGPMHTKDKEVIVVAEKSTAGLENKLPEIRELLDDMEKDHILQHELMLYYHKYKQNKDRPVPGKIEPGNKS